MSAPTRTMHVDPGHGWLEVPVAELVRLGIADEISRYSYQSRDGKTAYLEEDCDFSRYVTAAGLRMNQAGWLRESYSAGDSFVRSLPHYSPPMRRDAWSGIADAMREPDYGGAFDGFTVTSDADGGL